LSTLFLERLDGRKDLLICNVCKSNFLVIDGLPILLVDDVNWRKKEDEIHGEVIYNTRKIPLEVHLARSAFVDKNTEAFLSEKGIDLTNDEILIVGCSFSELEFFSLRSRGIVAFDIVPFLAKDCLRATQEKRIRASWFCGDGECLPLKDESFDCIIVRQTMHHMLKYHSAICEFFRVCKRGGSILLIDEPFCVPDLNDLPLLPLPNKFHVYKGVRLGQIREKLNFTSLAATHKPEYVNINSLEKMSSYIKPDQRNIDSFLADKYHSFSLLSCIYSLRLHTAEFQLIWPREVAWTEESDKTVTFCYGNNPNYDKSLIDKLISPGNVSLVAKKNKRTSVFRDRHDLRALPLDLSYKLANTL
jgi:SAM-dependent methyltransferase